MVWRVAGIGKQSPVDALCPETGAVFRGPVIGRDDGGVNGMALGIHENQAIAIAGQAYGSDLRSGNASLCNGIPDHGDICLPNLLRVPFGKAGSRNGQGHLGAGNGNFVSGVVKNGALDIAAAIINANQIFCHSRYSFLFCKTGRVREWILPFLFYRLLRKL